MPLWLIALGATLLMQTSSSFLTRAMPVIGPVLTDAAGQPPETVGYLAACTAAGTLWCLAGSAAVLPRTGAVRLLQFGTVVGAVGLLLTLGSSWLGMLAAATLVGVGYAPSPPAGSDILVRHAPKRHMSLVFSIKQAGVPLGGVLAGLIIPAAALAYGWQSAMLISAVVALGMAILVQPWRKPIDAERDRRHPLAWKSFVSHEILTGPWRSLTIVPGLPAITYLGFSFAIVQGSLLAFLVTYLTTELSFGLAAAGAAFAIMQVAGTFARIGLGWLADRLGSNRSVLGALCVGSAAAILLIAAMDKSWPALVVTAVSAASGIASISWNGVYLAEVARMAPAGAIGRVTAGSTFFTFIGYVIGPALFARVVGLTESYAFAFVLTSLLPLSALGLLLRVGRERPS